jgi:hypothetical protein
MRLLLTFTVAQQNILADDLFFSRIKEDLVSEQLNAVIRLEEQFIKNMDQLEITKKIFDPRKCYTFTVF